VCGQRTSPGSPGCHLLQPCTWSSGCLCRFHIRGWAEGFIVYHTFVRADVLLHLPLFAPFSICSPSWMQCCGNPTRALWANCCMGQLGPGLQLEKVRYRCLVALEHFDFVFVWHYCRYTAQIPVGWWIDAYISPSWFSCYAVMASSWWCSTVHIICVLNSVIWLLLASSSLVCPVVSLGSQCQEDSEGLPWFEKCTAISPGC
jgi:hypothetical protein